MLASTSLELKECKKFLSKECSVNNHLKKELHQFKVSASAEWKVNTKVSSIIQRARVCVLRVAACMEILL